MIDFDLTMPHSRRISVVHETAYRYGANVELAHHVAFLRPLEDDYQRLLSFEMNVDPRPAHHTSGRDFYDNTRTFFSIIAPHDALLARSTSRVHVLPRYAELDGLQTPPWEAVRDRLRYVAGAPYERAAEFVAPSPYVPWADALRDYAMPSFEPERPLADAALNLMHRVHSDFTYETASTEIGTPVLDVLRDRRGVCQDFSHLMIGALRSLGLAARYVSGYLLTVRGPGTHLLVGADASHAWVSVYCPGTPGIPGEWLDLDPTNAMVPQAEHVRLAVGRDYGDVTPLRGVIRGGGRHQVEVRVTTRREG